MFHYRFSFLLYNGRLSLEFDSVRLFCVRVSVGVRGWGPWGERRGKEGGKEAGQENGKGPSDKTLPQALQVGKQKTENWRPLFMCPEETGSPAQGGSDVPIPRSPSLIPTPQAVLWLLVNPPDFPTPPSAPPSSASATLNVPQTWFWCGPLLFQFLPLRGKKTWFMYFRYSGFDEWRTSWE